MPKTKRKRPPLEMIGTRITPDYKERIDRLGIENIAQFLREALLSELERREAIAKLEEL